MKYIGILTLLIITACSSKLMDRNATSTITKAIAKGEDISISGITIDEEINLLDIVPMSPLNEKSNYGSVNGNLYFYNCTFKKPFVAFNQNNKGGENAIQFKGNISFVNCKFESEFSIRSCSVNGAADFSNTTFAKKSNFQDAIFMQRANFNKTFWQDEALFQNVRFYHKTNFMDIIAHNHIMFQAAVFHDETNFSMSECLKYVDFSLVRFEGPALFNYIKWKDRAVFNDAVWMVDCTFVDPEFNDVSFKNSDMRGKYLMRGEQVNGILIPIESE